MLSSIREEIVLRKEYLPIKNLRSVYFGGGTPSLLNPSEIKEILDLIRGHYELDITAEITLEANPDDLNETIVHDLRSAGINRLSIGIQSFRNEDLKWMNRAHTAEQALDAVNLSRSAGFDNITVDLIYGLPGLELPDWEDHLQKVVSLDVDHISAYCLTIEERTALHKWVKTGSIKPAGEDLQSEQFDLMVRFLAAHGFEQYEISNFARNGKYAVHNSAYWTGESYLGVGPSAHSFNGNSRRWNVANNTRYIHSIGKNNDWFEEELLSEKDKWNELILTGLRTAFGLDLKQLSTLRPLSDQFSDKIDEFSRYGWVRRSHDKIYLTPEGKLMADHISSELFIT